MLLEDLLDVVHRVSWIDILEKVMRNGKNATEISRNESRGPRSIVAGRRGLTDTRRVRGGP